MLEILSRVHGAIKDLGVEDAVHSAEPLMLQSHVVVSDVSSVLWWASLQTGLVAISLDLWSGRRRPLQGDPRGALHQ